VAVTGRLYHGGRSATPLARAWVVLHEVALGGRGGAIDSARTDARGAYTLAIARPDTDAIYVVSSWYQGIAYFSEPVRPVGRPAVSVAPLTVYDTSATGAAVRVARRLVTIARPQQDGTREVLEMLELENPGIATRIARDSTRPVWAGAIPAGGIQFRVGQGDVSPQAVARTGDTIAVFAPIPPGDPKQLTYGYVLPADARRVAIPIDQPVEEVDLLLEDTTATVAAPGLEALGVDAIERRRFARYRVRAPAPPAQVVVTLPGGPFQVQQLVPIVVGLLALALIVGFVVALRKRQPSAVSHQPSAGPTES
jgi:hypothetical protein